MINTRRTGSAEYGRWIKALIAGQPGSGKTLVSSTFPYPYFASAEGGLMSIAHMDIPYVELTDPQDGGSKKLFELKKDLEAGPQAREQLLGGRIDTIVLDTIDEIQRMLARERMAEKKRDKLTLEDWGWLGDKMDSIVTGFRNLDMHVVFTCHIKESRDDEQGTITYGPDLQGRFANQLPGKVDLALLLTNTVRTGVVNNQTQVVIERFLQTYPDVQHPWVKDRSGKLDSLVTVNFEDDFARMNEAIFKGIDQKQRAEIREKVKELKQDLEEPEAAPTKAPVAVVLPTHGDTFTCAKCNIEFTDSDQAALSQIRVRETLCKPCYTEVQTLKRGK